MKYNRATIAKKSGVRNLQAVVTVPIELREIVGRKQIGLSTGTNDEKIARQRLSDLESQLYKRLDEADLANHPLVKAVNALQETLRDGVQWEAKDWFDPVRRWDAEDDVRSRVGKAISTFNRTDKLETSTDRVAALVSELDLP